MDKLYQSLLDGLVGVATLVIPVVGVMIVQVLRKLSNKWHLEGAAQDNANLETEIRTVLNVGIAKVLPLINQRGWNDPDVRKAVLAEAATYMTQRFPERTAAIIDAAKQDGSTITSRDEKLLLTDTLAGRFPAAMASASDGPATPPVPPAVIIPS